MIEPDDTSPNDPLFALLDSYVVAGMDIEQHVMAAVAAERAFVATRPDPSDLMRALPSSRDDILAVQVAALKAEIAALRTDVADLKYLLKRQNSAVPLIRRTGIDESRGREMLPLIATDRAHALLG